MRTGGRVDRITLLLATLGAPPNPPHMTVNRQRNSGRGLFGAARHCKSCRRGLAVGDYHGALNAPPLAAPDREFRVASAFIA